MKSLLRYAAVGAVATLVHYGVLMGTVEALHWRAAPAAALAAWIGAQVAYVGNTRYTFDGARLGLASWCRFQATAALGAGLSFGCVAIGVAVGLHYLAAQLVATLLALFATFAINRRWTFARSTATRG